MAEKSWMQREWTPQEGMIACISIQQPFVQAIVFGKKTIETRRWGTHYRGTLLLHSGKTWAGEREYGKNAAMRMDAPFCKRLGLPAEVAAYPLGAVVGIADLVKCATFSEEGWYKLEVEHQHDGYWDATRYGWQFANVRRFVVPIPARGQLGLFGIETALVAGQIETAIDVPFTPVPRQDSPEDQHRPMSIRDTQRMLAAERAAGYWPPELEDIG